MNLHAIVAPIIAVINPMLTAQYQASTGSAVGSDFKPIAGYATAVPMVVQRQALTYNDLKQVDGINLGGEAIALYCYGEVVGVRRADGKGGDLFTMPDGTKFLVAHVLENWSATAGWTKVACVRQLA